MNTFPDEVLYNILTHLPPGYMLMVDKHISSLHNELYYKEILKNTYNKLELKPFSTWKDLYLRSKEEGYVSVDDMGWGSSYPSVKAIKALNYLPFKDGKHQSNMLLLRFNGDLLLLNTIKEQIIDNGVSDICCSGYIKENKFYGLFETDTNVRTQLLAESNDIFMFISGENGINTCAATQTKLYNYVHINNPKCFLKSFDFAIRAIETTCIGAVDVLLDTGYLVVLDSQLSEINTISNILNIKTSFIQTKQEYLLLPMLDQPIGNFREKTQFKAFLDTSIKLPLNLFDEVSECFKFMEGYFILTKGVLFLIKHDGSMSEITTERKIKRICGQYGRHWIFD
jgi:hypothetical protein